MQAISSGCIEPAERGARYHLLLEIAADDAGGVGALGFHSARRNGVDADFARAEFGGEHARYGVDTAPLVAECTAAGQHRLLACYRGDVDDAAATPGRNVWPLPWRRRIVPSTLVLNCRWNSSSVMSSSGWKR